MAEAEAVLYDDDDIERVSSQAKQQLDALGQYCVIIVTLSYVALRQRSSRPCLKCYASYEDTYTLLYIYVFCRYLILCTFISVHRAIVCATIVGPRALCWRLHSWRVT